MWTYLRSFEVQDAAEVQRRIVFGKLECVYGLAAESRTSIKEPDKTWVRKWDNNDWKFTSYAEAARVI